MTFSWFQNFLLDPDGFFRLGNILSSNSSCKPSFRGQKSPQDKKVPIPSSFPKSWRGSHSSALHQPRPCMDDSSSQLYARLQANPLPGAGHWTKSHCSHCHCNTNPCLTSKSKVKNLKNRETSGANHCKFHHLWNDAFILLYLLLSKDLSIVLCDSRPGMTCPMYHVPSIGSGIAHPVDPQVGRRSLKVAAYMISLYFLTTRVHCSWSLPNWGRVPVKTPWNTYRLSE